MTTLALSVRPERPEDAAEIERLHERAFGPGRFARTAFRLREGALKTPDLCFAATVGTLLVGSVRMSPIVIGAAPALVLGPLAVEPAFEKRGIGGVLVRRAVGAARIAGHDLAILVGDEPYYGRFGFARAPAGRLRLPAPVDPTRLLVAELVPGAFEGVGGRVTARRD